MRDSFLKTVVSTILVLIGLSATVACAAPQAPPDPVDHDVSFARGETVRVIEVRRGERIRFIAANLTVFVVIPDGNLQEGNGCEDWASTGSYVAFKIDHGSATVIVPEDYQLPNEEKTIWYSVMVYDDERSEYLSGENPPPRIIIR